ncbi:MAG: MoxR family ATPase [Blastocatellia bacterium]|nr:MoxR family ATPase [Blastocatellia bacterium]
MSYPYYTGNPRAHRENVAAELPGSRREEQTRPEGYLPDAGLVDAANVALLLAQPLLLTGEPGVGKTQFAHSLAWELGLGKPLPYETKSTSTARDLFYGYDTIGRFHAAQTREGSVDSLDYLTWHALGIAILQSQPREKVAQWLPEGFEHSGPRRSVVLIDEIDKAPRDFPNDLLNEVESGVFRVPELRNARIEANSALPPILVLTSNSEKNLPEAFLRRCVYYHIPFPDRARLTEIVASRVSGLRDGALLAEALDLFERLREPGNEINKKPATAELLGWLIALREVAPAGGSLKSNPEIARRTMSALLKESADQAAARAIVDRWLTP